MGGSDSKIPDNYAALVRGTGDKQAEANLKQVEAKIGNVSHLFTNVFMDEHHQFFLFSLF